MICRDIEWRSPLAAFSPLAGEPYAHLLHGGALSTSAEWSIIVAFPRRTIVLRDGEAGAWLAEVQGAIDVRRAPQENAFAGLPFVSGLVGYVGYEALGALEASLRLPQSPEALADAGFGVYDAAALFSRKTERAFIVGADEAACERLEGALGTAPPGPSALEIKTVSANFSRKSYCAAVEAIIEKILNGDFYQANISQRLIAECAAPFLPLGLFAELTADGDADFGALLQFEEGAIISNSPERFFSLRAEAGRRRILVEPIKGTRRRGRTTADDLELMRALQSDPKDRAENIMIADLMRNDLSKICKDGSVREEAICELLSLARVHHLVSRISGDVHDDARLSDIFRALFPSGSVTGAPKLEAMSAIAAAEGAGRGPYCGAIGYVDDRGGADFSVAIRTMTASKEATRLSIPAGGGVTLRSNPDEEYDETLVKAVGAIDAVAPWIGELA